VSLIRRDNGDRTAVALDQTVASVGEALGAAQGALLAEAEARRDERTAEVSTVAEAREAAQDGFARVPWRNVGVDGEAELAAAGVSVRCLLDDDVAIVGRAY
jgi:prolyl-tRNA synthetase